MYLDIARKDLLNPLKTVASVVEQRQTLPILGNTLLSVGLTELILTASDAEVEIIQTIALEEPSLDESDSGACCIPARKFLDIVNSLPANAQIKLTEHETLEEKYTVKSGRSKFSLASLPVEDFPNSPEFEEGRQEFKIDSDTLLDMITKCAFSMAVDDARYYLNGLLFDFERTDTLVFTVVGTDGHRLASYELKEGFENAENLDAQQLIIPKKAINVLAKILRDNKESAVSIKFDTNHAQFSIGNTIMTTKLIDGRFPDYKAVLPTICDKTVTAKREPLIQALQRVSILSNEKFKGMRLSLAKDVLKLNAKNAYQEESEEYLEVDYAGGELEIGFNSQYLVDVLNIIDTDSVEFHFTDENSSCLINPKDSDTEKYVVMPMRL